MLRNALERVVLRYAPGILPGCTLHRHALSVFASGRPALAEAIFEAAAAAYRRELRVEPLARLRVHQSLARARASVVLGEEAEHMLEIVRSLNRLDRLESLRAPFALCDARAVLSEWLSDKPHADGSALLERAA
jgi:signal transduction histidine kinase